MHQREKLTDILEGIRMVECGAWIAGTGAGVFLGQLGAEVIKIEDPVRGDSYRGMATQYGDRLTVKGRHIGFETTNMNKKGMTLDLAKPAAREILYQLIAKSDVFFTNFPRRVVRTLGLAYETLKGYNERLIYSRVTGYGPGGLLGDRRCFDTLAQARSGVMWAMGDQDIDEPLGVTAAFFDHATAMVTALGIICALAARGKSGKGQLVDSSLFGTALYLQTHNINRALWRGRAQPRYARKRSPNPMANNYRCADGKWVMFAEPQSDRFWAEFCEALGLLHMKDDVRFSTSGSRAKNSVELIKTLDGAMASRSRDEWVKVFEEKSVGFGYSPVYDLAEATKDPQAIENEYITEFDHPVLGKVNLAGFPILFSDSPTHVRRAAPEHGQHTEEVLSSVLGYNWDQLAKLKEAGVI